MSLSTSFSLFCFLFLFICIPNEECLSRFTPFNPQTQILPKQTEICQTNFVLSFDQKYLFIGEHKEHDLGNDNQDRKDDLLPDPKKAVWD